MTTTPKAPAHTTLVEPLRLWNTSPRDWSRDVAAWLNGLGPDAAPFGKFGKATNGEVRRNWTHGSPHFRKVDQ